MSEDTILQAVQSFSALYDGAPRHVHKGETFRVGHPLVDGRELFFKAYEVDNEWPEASPKPAKKSKKADES